MLELPRPHYLSLIVGLFLGVLAKEAQSTSLGGGLQLIPQKVAKKAAHCRELSHFFSLTGLKDVRTRQKVNNLLRASVEISEGCVKSAAELEVDETLRPYSFEREMKEVRKIGDTVVFKVLESSYTGGVHENFQYQTHVIDLKQGEELDLERLFTDRGREELIALGKAKLKKYFQSKNEIEWTSQPLSIRTNQILPSGAGFQVQFNPYEVDCFAAGAPIIHFTAQEASRIFRPSHLFGTTKRW
jgi:hypothetical protein